MKTDGKTKPYSGPKPKMFRLLIDDISVPKRCRKPNSWIHYRKDELILCGKKDIYRLFCGPRITDKVNNVTCPRCIEALKKDHWYCPTHGFIDDKNVTYEETCEFCGEDV